MLMDEGMFLMKQYPASGAITGWTYMGEVDPTTEEADDPRPFVTATNTAQNWSGGIGYSHVRRSPVDDSTLVELTNRPSKYATQSVATTYADIGPEYVSNVSLYATEPAGHRFIQGYLRNVGACDRTLVANRATLGYDGTDYRFEVFNVAGTSPHIVTRYPPGTALGAGHTVITAESVPTQLERPAIISPPTLPSRMFGAIRSLFPRSFAWNLVYERTLVQFVRGLVHGGLDPAQRNFDAIWDELDPKTTSLARLADWERQFALGNASSLTEQERRDRLAAAWAAVGGQSPGYITDTLQAAGFPVYTHEWWDLTAWGFPDPKDPRDYLRAEFGGTDSDGYLIRSLIRTSRKVNEIGAGEAWAEAGEPRAIAGYFEKYLIENITYEYKGPESAHRFYLYIGGETFPDTVDIPLSRRGEFETLCRKICPAQQWLVLRVNYV
jgi:hypothetical protein